MNWERKRLDPTGGGYSNLHQTVPWYREEETEVGWKKRKGGPGKFNASLNLIRE